MQLVPLQHSCPVWSSELNGKKETTSPHHSHLTVAYVLFPQRPRPSAAAELLPGGGHRAAGNIMLQVLKITINFVRRKPGHLHGPCFELLLFFFVGRIFSCTLLYVCLPFCWRDCCSGDENFRQHCDQPVRRTSEANLAVCVCVWSVADRCD